jgi:ectoine hydroxylase
MKLTQQQIDDFNREGWLFLPELFSAEEVDLLAREAEGIYDTKRPEVWREKSGAPPIFTTKPSACSAPIRA